MLWWVQVRCACRRKKEKRPCDLARQQLQDTGLPAEIDGSSAVQLLNCDSKCHQLQVHRHWLGIVQPAVSLIRAL